MPPVKGQRSVVTANAANVILEPADGAVDGVRPLIHISQGFAICVSRGHEKAARESSVQLGLKGVVVRTGSHELESDVAGEPVQSEERPVLVGCRAARKRCSVQIIDGRQIHAVIAHIRHFRDELPRQGTLHGEIPGLRVRLTELQIHHSVVLSEETGSSDFTDHWNKAVRGNVRDQRRRESTRH